MKINKLLLSKRFQMTRRWCETNRVLIILISIFCISMTLWALIPYMIGGNRYWADIGFHLRFTKDIIESQDIPLYTPWFNGGQPYIYPPLGHILTAVMSFFVPIDLITLYNFLMNGIVYFGIFPVYLLTKEITNDARTSVLASFIYVFQPILSVRITQTSGFSANHVAIVFMILFFAIFIHEFKNNGTRMAILAGIFLGIQPYTHTMTMVVMAFWFLPIVLIFKFLQKEGRMAKFKNTIITFLVAGLLSLPYFHRRALSVEYSKSLLNTAGIGSALPESTLSILSRFVSFGKEPAHLFASDEFFLFFVGLSILSMSFFAIIYSLRLVFNKKGKANKMLIIPTIWFILLFIASIGYKINISFVPGSYRYHLFLIIPSTILIAIFMTETIRRAKSTNNIISNLIILVLLLIVIVPVIHSPLNMHDYTWSKDERNDMAWLKNNTPEDATIATWYMTGVAIPYIADRRVPFAMTGTIGNTEAVSPLRKLLWDKNINDNDIVNILNKLNATYIFEKKPPLIKYHGTIWAGITPMQYDKYNHSKVLKKIYESDNFVAFQLVQNLSLNVWGEYDTDNGTYNSNNFDFLLQNTFLAAPEERWDLTAEYAISTHPISYFRYTSNLDHNQDHKTDYTIRINISYLDNSKKTFEVYALKSGIDSGDFKKAPPLIIAEFKGTNSNTLKPFSITIPEGSEINGKFFVRDGLWIKSIGIERVE